jgi:hypothetical protein
MNVIKNLSIVLTFAALSACSGGEAPQPPAVSEGEGEDAGEGEGEGDNWSIDVIARTQEELEEKLLGVTFLDSLAITGSVTSLAPLRSLTAVGSLGIYNTPELSDFSGADLLESVGNLSIDCGNNQEEQCLGIVNIRGFPVLKNLTTLSISKLRNIRTVSLASLEAISVRISLRDMNPDVTFDFPALQSIAELDVDATLPEEARAYLSSFVPEN